MRNRFLVVAAAAVLLLLIGVTWREVHAFEFVHWDDADYVYANPIVTGGITANGVVRGFGFHAGNWHPLTWLSHMADVEWFGLDAGRHHLTSVLLHACNAIALLLVLVRFTGQLGRSLFVAAIFAVHPLNVENVVWIAERKTLLSVFFALLTILFWHFWIDTGRRRHYAAAIAAFALALMAKPYVVMLPLLLVCADFWPLRRLRVETARALALEKAPLCALSIASAAVTWLAQAREGAVAASGSLPLLERTLHAAIAGTWYLRKAFWPSDLIFFYPHPATAGEAVSRLAAFGATALLTTITIAAIRARRSSPALLFGWTWFLVALVPVIGVVQVGQQAWADRYTYLPLLGLAIAVTWTVADITPRSMRAALPLVAVALIVVMATATTRQARHWRNSAALFDHALRVDPTNWVAWQNVGVLAIERGDLDGAMRASERSLSSNPRNALAMYNVAYAWSMRGRADLARPWYERAVAERPDDVQLLLGLSLNLLDLGQPAAALQLARRALALAPESELALYAAAVTASRSAASEEARRALGRLRHLSPRLAAEAEASMGILR